jgi:hypothetical protein
MATIEGKRLVRVSTTKALAAASAYDAEDVLSESASNGVGTDWDFAAVAKVNGGSGYIVKAQAISETTAVVPRLTLFLFNAVPTSELDDHAANTALLHADLANYVGKIDFPAMSDLGTGDSEAVASPSTTGNLPLAFNCATAADDLYGIVVTRDAFTQTAGADLTITLVVEQY